MLPYVALCCPMLPYVALCYPMLPYVALSYLKVGLYCSKAGVRVLGGVGWWWVVQTNNRFKPNFCWIVLGCFWGCLGVVLRLSCGFDNNFIWCHIMYIQRSWQHNTLVQIYRGESVLNWSTVCQHKLIRYNTLSPEKRVCIGPLYAGRTWTLEPAHKASNTCKKIVSFRSCCTSRNFFL